LSSAIFISYRRSDAGGHAGRMHDRLVECFEPGVVFYDLESIDGGADFPDRLSGAVDDAKALLVLIGPDWVAELGRRAMRSETDFVHREVQLALDRRRATGQPLVLPVLLGGALPPSAADLPAALRELADLNAVVFQGNRADWDFKFKQLLQMLATVPGVPEPDEPRARRRLWPLAAAALAAVAGVALWAGLQARSGLKEAEEQLRIGRYDLADKRLQAVPGLSRWWPSVRLASDKARLGDSQFVPRPDWERFGLELKRLLAQAPQDTDLLVLRAQNEMREGQWDAARKTADLATQGDPRHAEAWFVRGSVQDANGELKAAEADYRRAADLAPESPHYRNNLAHTQLEDGRFEEAIASYERIKRFALAPLEQAKAHWARGEFGLAAERQQAAISLLERADADQDGFNTRAWTFYGRRLVQLGPTADKQCYAHWSLAASLRLAGGTQSAFPPLACPTPVCAVKQALDFDLDRYVRGVDPAVQQAVTTLRNQLGDTDRCVAHAPS